MKCFDHKEFAIFLGGDLERSNRPFKLFRSGCCLKTRCTTLVPMPSLRPILSIPSPAPLSSIIRASTAGSTRRRPSLVPFALARASPELILSRIIPRSNTANTAHI